MTPSSSSLPREEGGRIAFARVYNIIRYMKHVSMKRTMYISLAAVLLLLAMSLWTAWPLAASMNDTPLSVSIYIDADDTQDSVMHKVGSPRRWRLLNRVLDPRPRTGHYTIQPQESMLEVYRKLRNGLQTPVNITIPQSRTMEQLAGYLSHRLMLDSALLATSFRDTAFCARLGYTPQTLPALFIPDTYQMWWNISVDKFMERMQKENAAFWNDARQAKAHDLGLSRQEIVTLASIVAEETAHVPEMPKVAGMYIQRLRIGMPLQADPTVKFALGDFSLRRIYHAHLQVESPYNTYRNPGLPPGPIRIPHVQAIDAVLNQEQHGYLYMCAKEDFSGSHNFARTYAEHQANARRYSRALNARGIR